MASAIVVACRGVRLACEAAAIYNQVDKLVSSPQEQTVIKSMSVGMNIILLILGAAECNSIAQSSSSTKTLHQIKGAEVCFRICDVYVKGAEQINDEQATIIQKIEKGLLRPVASVCRAANESQGYGAKVYLEMTPEELSAVKIPIYEHHGRDRMVLVGHKGITRDEAQALFDSAKNSQNSLAVTEMVMRAEPMSKIEKLYSAIVSAPPPIQVAPQNPPVAVQGNDQERDPFDLLTLNSIPDLLHDDPVFARYICPITQGPVRHPMRDKNGKTVYERDEIVKYLVQSGISPFTRQPHTVAELQPVPALQRLIDNQLAFHSERLRALARTQAAINNPDLLAAAQVENPTL